MSYPSRSMCWAMSFEISNTLASRSLEYRRSSSGVPLKPIVSPSRTCPADSTATDLMLVAVSEFANVVLRGARVISGEALLCANLGFGLRLVSNAGGQRHTLLFETGPEAAIFIRNCTALGVGFREIEAIAITHGHWDHMAALPATIDRIIQQGGRVTVHVNPGMFNERAIRLSSGKIIPVANVPLPSELDR